MVSKPVSQIPLQEPWLRYSFRKTMAICAGAATEIWFGFPPSPPSLGGNDVSWGHHAVRLKKNLVGTDFMEFNYMKCTKTVS
jgi:hypothetical protein